MLQRIDKPDCELESADNESGHKETFSGLFKYEGFWEKYPVDEDYQRYFEKITAEETGKVTWFEDFETYEELGMGMDGE